VFEEQDVCRRESAGLLAAITYSALLLSSEGRLLLPSPFRDGVCHWYVLLPIAFPGNQVIPLTSSGCRPIQRARTSGTLTKEVEHHRHAGRTRFRQGRRREHSNNQRLSPIYFSVPARCRGMIRKERSRKERERSASIVLRKISIASREISLGKTSSSSIIRVFPLERL
jgi:hypothetical protein